MSLHTWPYLMHVALLVALYVGTAKLGLSLHAVGGFATAAWPPTGLALVSATVGVTSGWLGASLRRTSTTRHGEPGGSRT
jgi:hypothetical protein